MKKQFMDLGIPEASQCGIVNSSSKLPPMVRPICNVALGLHLYENKNHKSDEQDPFSELFSIQHKRS